MNTDRPKYPCIVVRNERRETVSGAIRRVLAKCDLPPEALEVLTLEQLAIIYAAKARRAG